MSIPSHIKKELSLIDKAKKDKRFFAPIYDHYYKQIYIFIFKKVQDETLTGDICSKTFLKAITNLDKYTYKGFPFSSWLYKIASNEVNMHFRSSKKHQVVQVLEKDVAEIISSFEDNDKEISIQELLNALSRLPDEQSELIDMRFFEQLSFKEIATIYSSSEASIKMKVYRILDKLKKQLTQGK